MAAPDDLTGGLVAAGTLLRDAAAFRCAAAWGRVVGAIDGCDEPAAVAALAPLLDQPASATRRAVRLLLATGLAGLDGALAPEAQTIIRAEVVGRVAAAKARAGRPAT